MYFFIKDYPPTPDDYPSTLLAIVGAIAESHEVSTTKQSNC